MRKILEFIVAVVFSVLFTGALIYATVEAPRALNEVLLNVLPDYSLGPFSLDSWELFGYVSLAVILILIVAGFAIKRLQLSTIGSVALFLPVFGYFATTMFLLSGIGVLQVLWLPLLMDAPTETAYNVLRLGDIVYLPYIPVRFIMTPFARIAGVPLTGINASFSLVIMVLGLMILFLSTVTWLYGKFTGFQIIDFWIYRYSRHPQYLGYLLWSYGLLLFVATLSPVPKGWNPPPPTLFWLICALTIVGVALQEEKSMVKKHGVEYLRYRDRTSFMLPLPKRISELIAAPARILLKKNRPENGKEVAFLIIAYGILLISLSLPSILFFKWDWSGKFFYF